MRKLVLAVACATAALTTSCSNWLATAHAQRVVILGVDGMDPDVARHYMREGRLPNLARLAARGGAYPLQTVSAADCIAAWSSFAAGREVSRPAVSHTPAQLLLNFVPLKEEVWATTRAATSFWVSAGNSGVRSSVLAVPGSFPPEPVPLGELLAGYPTPDVRNTDGTYQFFGTTVAPADEGVSPNGGLVRRLTFNARVAEVRLLGPLHPVTREELFAPMTITWNHEARSANVQVAETAVHLREREWSRAIEVSFPINAIARVRGVTQLYLRRAGTELELYVAPVQWHPQAPPAPISSPRAFARELYDRIGLFRTNGWNAATAALMDDRIDEAAFLDDIDRAFQDRAETILNRIDAAEWNLLVGVIETPDRVQHVMWRLTDASHPRYDAELARRYGASIEQAYRQADDLLGEILARVDTETLVMVVSDHGFHAVQSASKWSGDHTAADPAKVAGLLVSNVKMAARSPRLIDIAPTVLKYFGVPLTREFEGQPLF